MQKQVLAGIISLGFVVLLRADQTFVFEETQERFANPERGFYSSAVLNKIDAVRPLEDLRYQYVTLVYGKVEANEFLDKDLSDDFLHKIDWGFYRVRQARLKVIFCVSYSDKIGAPDASLDAILRHIDQLKPILQENADVLYLAEAGFIGPLGQWHHWQNGKETTDNYRRVLMRLLGALPKERMVAICTPQNKLDIFDGKTLIDKQAFSGIPIARVGHYNDCFLSGQDDTGTYTAKNPRWAWIEYIGSETRFVPFGGETCKPDPLSDCANALDEMKRLHCSWLNWNYHPKVREHWQKSGCLDEIERRLGYRLVLRSVSITSGISPDDQNHFDVQIQLDNVGFASPFNPRPVELILRSENKVYIQSLDEDPRFWLPGKPITIKTTLKIPDEFFGRTCRLELCLPDGADKLRNDPRYAIRLANTGVWDESLGSNVLIGRIEIPKPEIQIVPKQR